MTDELLKGLAAQASNMAKMEMRSHHQLNGLLAVYYEGDGLHRLRKIERLAVEHYGEDWLNSGQAKEIIFGVLCAGALALPPDAIAVATVVTAYWRTPAFDALPTEERELVGDDPGRYPEYLKPHDALMSIVQTSERVCISTHRLQGSLLIGQPEISVGPQEGFGGRIKMYGKSPHPKIAQALETVVRKWTADRVKNQGAKEQ